MASRGSGGWQRFLIESGVIVSSILLALDLDDWWDGVQRSNERTELTTALISDLETKKLRLAETTAEQSSSMGMPAPFCERLMLMTRFPSIRFVSWPET